MGLPPALRDSPGDSAGDNAGGMPGDGRGMRGTAAGALPGVRDGCSWLASVVSGLALVCAAVRLGAPGPRRVGDPGTTPTRSLPSASGNSAASAECSARSSSAERARMATEGTDSRSRNSRTAPAAHVQRERAALDSKARGQGAPVRAVAAASRGSRALIAAPRTDRTASLNTVKHIESHPACCGHASARSREWRALRDTALRNAHPARAAGPVGMPLPRLPQVTRIQCWQTRLS